MPKLHEPPLRALKRFEFVSLLALIISLVPCQLESVPVRKSSPPQMEFPGLPASKDNLVVDNIVTRKANVSAVEVVTAGNHVTADAHCRCSAAGCCHTVLLQGRVYVCPPCTASNAGDLGFFGVGDLVDKSWQVISLLIWGYVSRLLTDRALLTKVQSDSIIN